MLIWVAKRSFIVFMIFLTVILLVNHKNPIKIEKQYKIACIGDSITADGGYIKRLKELCPTNYVFYNYGVSSESARTIHKRIINQHILETNWDYVIILAGINKVYDHRQVKEDLEDIYADAAGIGPNVKIVSVTITPWRKYRAQIYNINRFCVLRNQLVDIHVDIHSALADTNEGLRKEYDSGDGIHPNTLGQKVIGDVIYKKVFKGVGR